MYPRVVRLGHSGDANGRLLATFERYTGTTPAFPIFERTDERATWTQVAEVTDQHYGWGMRYQPMLYELPREVGDMPAGTLLAPLVPSANGSRLLELASVSIGLEHCRIDAATAPTPTG